MSEQHRFAEAAKKVPNGVVCLLSALRFHNLTTQSPFEVWIALDHKAWQPRPGPGLAFRFHRFSGKALTAGVERHVVDGVPVKVYGIAKTVADCFKFRNKIGLDVALEALRETRRGRRATSDERRAVALRADLPGRERNASLPGVADLRVAKPKNIAASVLCGERLSF